MRKWWLTAFLVALLIGLALPAAAQTLTFDKIGASVEVPDSYTVVITPENVATFEKWLQTERNTSVADAQTDFEQRGVLAQIWSDAADACLEITALSDQESRLVFNVDEQTEAQRGAYRLSHYPKNNYPGYEYKSAQWKRSSVYGRFLVLKYNHKTDGEIDWRGYSRKTIRNGYTITLDMKVFGRKLANKDNTALNKVWHTWKFTELFEMPKSADAKVYISSPPPEVTNSATFNIEGTASEGVVMTAVVASFKGVNDFMNFSAVAGKKGDFSLPIKLPRDGVYNIILYGDLNGEDVIQLSYQVTYGRTMLPVKVLSEIPEQTTEDTLTISGTAPYGTKVQFLVNGANESMKVRANGKFSRDIKTKKEGMYDITVVFSLAGASDVRLEYHVERVFTDEQKLTAIKKSAIKPSYKVLNNKLAGYAGKVMGYALYVVKIEQAGDEWLITMAFNNKNGAYTNQVIVRSADAPEVMVDSKVRMYGTCTGQDADLELPSFDLLFFEQIAG